MTAADREPVPLPVRCPKCGARMEANVSPGSTVEWTCRKCKRHVVVEVPEAA